MMEEYITFYVQTIILIVLPVWIYLWFDKSKVQQLSLYLGLDIQYSLKLWWALWCISKEKKPKNKFDLDEMCTLKEIFKPHVDNPKIIMDKNSCDSVCFYGADQKGNSLYVKMNHRGYRMAEVMLQVILADGRVYVLPNYPNTVMMENTGQKWSVSGLNIELLESRKRWRITFNGLLRNQCLGETPNDENVEHIRLNFIYIASSPAFEWPGDWHPRLHAAALAREPWKGPDWMYKIKLLDYTGFDQWGSVIGQITFKDSTESTLYLRGFCQRRWGKHESYQFRGLVTFLGVAESGAMYYLGVIATRNSFSRMLFGYVKHANETISTIDHIDLKLEDFQKQGDHVPANYKISFQANNKIYNAFINHTGNDAINCYNGQPWRWAITTRILRIKLNGSKGFGLMITNCPYFGSTEMEIPITKMRHFTRQESTVSKNYYVLHFSDKGCQNESVVGGKGYSLAVLTSLATDDFIVPQGFCVTSSALELHLQHYKQLHNMITDLVDIARGKKKADLKDSCEKLVSLIEITSVVDVVKKAILEAVIKLELSNKSNQTNTRNRYAVRSSAVGEDSEETSAAGQNSTYLGITNADEVVLCVAKCWASLYTYQSVQYRRQNGLPIRGFMGVCVQRMVDAEAAGVMFTRHPTTGDPSSILITANYGLGETVVSGMVEPDTLTVRRKWDNTLIMSDSVLGNKGQKISMTKDGVVTYDLSKQEAGKMSISDETALRLAKIGLNLELIFGSARDIEWAVAGEKIYLLQARPITTINAWTDFELIHELDSGVPADVDLMTFANVGEVMPRPLSPLSISTVVKVLNLSIGTKSFNCDCNYLHIVAMRCAMNYFITSLRNIGDHVTMEIKMADIAICGRIITTPEVHKNAIAKFGVANTKQNMDTIANIFQFAWTNEKVVKEAIKMYNKFNLNADKFNTASELYDTINNKYVELFMLGKYHTHTSRVSVCYQMLAMLLLAGKSDSITNEHLADIAVLLSSCTNVISTEVPIALNKIAACIRKSGKAKDFSKVEPVKAVDWLKSNCPAAAEKLLDFYDKHGHRCVQELDLYSEPWILKPDCIINTIQALATDGEENYVSKPLSVEKTLASLKTPLSSFTKWFLRKIIPLSRKAVTRREMTKNFAVSVVHTLRMAYKRLGVLMMEENYIPDEKLIFFLTHEEIGQFLNNHHNPLLVRKALRRKKIHQQMSTLEYPEFCTGMPLPIQKTIDASSYEDNVKIEGTSVYGGSVMARACVITDLSQAKDIQNGDILITHCTDIGWSPYFPLLSGIVTELGGLISHGAVVAREYGLPCIVGAKQATQKFRTGDTVLLAANVGVLQLIDKGESTT